MLDAFWDGGRGLLLHAEGRRGAHHALEGSVRQRGAERRVDGLSRAPAARRAGRCEVHASSREKRARCASRRRRSRTRSASGRRSASSIAWCAARSTSCWSVRATTRARRRSRRRSSRGGSRTARSRGSIRPTRLHARGAAPCSPRASPPDQDVPVAYVCRGRTCSLPVSTPEALARAARLGRSLMSRLVAGASRCSLSPRCPASCFLACAPRRVRLHGGRHAATAAPEGARAPRSPRSRATRPTATRASRPHLCRRLSGAPTRAAGGLDAAAAAARRTRSPCRRWTVRGGSCSAKRTMSTP